MSVFVHFTAPTRGGFVTAKPQLIIVILSEATVGGEAEESVLFHRRCGSFDSAQDDIGSQRFVNLPYISFSRS